MPGPIDAYLAGLPAPQQQALASLRALIVSAVPGAEEAIRTRVPAIRYRGRTVVGFGASRDHLALYVMFGQALRQLGAELAPFDTSKTVVRFTAALGLPEELVRKIVAVRVAEIDAQMAAPASGTQRRAEAKG